MKPYKRHKLAEQLESIRKVRIELHDELLGKERVQVIQAYGGKCACCGESHIEFMEVHHINLRGGLQRRRLRTSGRMFYSWLIENKFPEGFQLLCRNCHMSIGRYGRCPHEVEQLKKGDRK